MAQSLDDPETRQRVVRALLVLAPFLFAGSFVFAALQGASALHSGIIAAIALGMCLGTAACIHLLGSASAVVLTAVTVVLGLLGMLLGR